MDVDIIPAEYKPVYLKLQQRLGEEPNDMLVGTDCVSNTHLPSHSDIHLSCLTGERIQVNSDIQLPCLTGERIQVNSGRLATLSQQISHQS